MVFSAIKKIYEVSLKFPKLTVTGFMVLFLVSVWGLKFSTLQLDIYDAYEPSFGSSVDLFELKDLYKDQSQMLVSFHFENPPKASELCRLQEWGRKINSYRGIKSVSSLWSIRRPEVGGNKLWYPKSLNDPCTLPPEESISLGESFKSSYFRHLFSSRGTQDLAFDVAFSGDELETGKVKLLMEETQNFLKDLPGVRASYLGHATFRYHIKKIIYEDSIYNLVVLLIILLFMRYIYGTWRSGAYLSITLICSCLVLYGMMGLLGAPIDILTSNLFLMTAVAGTADFIFVSHFQLKGSYFESFEKLAIPCFFTTFTTVLGFLSLNTSDLDIIRRFGNGAALGAMIEWIIMFTFMPATLKMFKLERNWVDPKKSANLSWLDVLDKLHLPRPVLWIFVGLMLISVPSFLYLNDYDSPVKNLPSKHELRKSYEEFKEKFGWEGQVYLYYPETIDKKESDSHLEKLGHMDLLFHIENPEDLKEEWTKDLSPLKKDLVLRELSMTPLWQRYYSSVGSLRIPLYLKEQDLHTLRKLRDEVDRICEKKCRLAGQRMVYLEYGEKISRTMVESFGLSILLVVGILLWLLKKTDKLREAIPIIVSSLIGPLCVLSLMAIFQVPVTLITSIFLAIMVGMAGDNAIQFILAGNDLDEAIADRGRASVLVAVVIMLGSSLFIPQSLVPMKILGGLFIVGFLINLVGDVWGLKAFLQDPKHRP